MHFDSRNDNESPAFALFMQRNNKGSSKSRKKSTKETAPEPTLPIDRKKKKTAEMKVDDLSSDRDKIKGRQASDDDDEADKGKAMFIKDRSVPLKRRESDSEMQVIEMADIDAKIKTPPSEDQEA